MPIRDIGTEEPVVEYPDGALRLAVRVESRQAFRCSRTPKDETDGVGWSSRMSAAGAMTKESAREPSLSIASIKLLSDRGSTRATRYATANKIVTLDGKTHLAWLDSVSQTMVATFSHATGMWTNNVKVGDGADNHGGPALTCDSKGYLHIVFGPHAAGPFQHCRSARPNDASEWVRLPKFADKATYPSVVCDARDTLHIVYRGHPLPPHLLYQRRLKGGEWTQPRSLAHTALKKPGYSHYHSALTIARDGSLHISYDLYGAGGGPAKLAGHMVSPDGGDTWVLADGTKLNLPVTPDSDAFFRRTETSLKTVGLVCDCQGNPWITVEAAEDGPELWHHDGEKWNCISLDERLGKNIASGKFGTVSPPTIDEQGRLYVMAGIGGNVMLMHSKDQGETFQVVSVFPRDKKLPHVGFSPERPTGHHTVGTPWLLFSTGEKGPDCFGHGIFHQVRAVQISLSVNQPH